TNSQPPLSAARPGAASAATDAAVASDVAAVVSHIHLCYSWWPCFSVVDEGNQFCGTLEAALQCGGPAAPPASTAAAVAAAEATSENADGKVQELCMHRRESPSAVYWLRPQVFAAAPAAAESAPTLH